jgi:hypothetical protein
MHDKMVMLTEWLRSLGNFFLLIFNYKKKEKKRTNDFENILDKMLKTNILQSGIETDSIDQLQNKLKRYTTEIESLRGKGIGKK